MQLPSSHFCTWTIIFSLLLFRRSLCCPTSTYRQSFARCLLFSCFGIPRFHAVPSLVFITSISTLIAIVSFHRMLSTHLFGLLFSVISLPPIINSFPNALQIFFKNIYHKNSKNIVHLLLRFICTRVFC